MLNKQSLICCHLKHLYLQYFTFQEKTADRSNEKDAVHFPRNARNIFSSAAKGEAVQRQLLITEVLRGTKKTDSS